jgi:hypothetical protein
MKKPELAPINIAGLQVLANPCDLLRDVHVYVEYMQEREVKRMYRSNQLSKADAGRLAKSMSDVEAPNEVRERGSSGWVDLVDRLALGMGLVRYKTQGTYRGYTSQEPSFPENYVIANEARVKDFRAMPPAGQEALVLQALIDNGPDELFEGSPLGILSGFYGWARAVLEAPGARRLLLEILGSCESGVWYSTRSLVGYLKDQHPYFLIPPAPRRDRLGSRPSRYGGFYETRAGRPIGDKPIPEDAPDSFERVEGRFIERFLEGLPLLLRYVEVAYTGGTYQGDFPEMNLLRAFRVTPHFVHARSGLIPPPNVTVQPNFEIIVESEIYPSEVLAQLRPLTEAVSEDPGGLSASVTILRLKKERVAAALINDQDLDVARLLRDLSGLDLPQNVAIELDEWGGHAELFTLYEGFGLLESADPLPLADNFTVERISPQLRLVRSPDRLFEQMERAELAPLAVKHPDLSLAELSQDVPTVFRQKASGEPLPEIQQLPQPVTLFSTTTIQLRFPGETIYEAFRTALLEARCPIEANPTDFTIRYSRQYQPQIDEIIRSLEDTYEIRIEEA